jgi:RNA polymerase sigma factor (sigma-70 family)
LTSDELIKQIASGDRTALKTLYAEFGKRVFNTALGLVQNREEAEEITQDVFVEVFRSAADFKFQSSVSTWLYRISMNKSLDAIRYRKRNKRFGFLTSIFHRESGEISVEKPDFEHPGVLLENQEKASILFKCIDKLAKSQRSAFVLSQVEQLPQKEIAAVMNLSEKAVESLLQRAKANLRGELEKFYPERRKP